MEFTRTIVSGDLCSRAARARPEDSSDRASTIFGTGHARDWTGEFGASCSAVGMFVISTAASAPGRPRLPRGTGSRRITTCCSSSSSDMSRDSFIIYSSGCTNNNSCNIIIMPWFIIHHDIIVRHSVLRSIVPSTSALLWAWLQSFRSCCCSGRLSKPKSVIPLHLRLEKYAEPRNERLCIIARQTRPAALHRRRGGAGNSSA